MLAMLKLQIDLLVQNPKAADARIRDTGRAALAGSCFARADIKPRYPLPWSSRQSTS